MKISRSMAVAAFVLAMTLCGHAFAWWDTQIQVVRQPPTVREVQAEETPNLPAGSVLEDKLAWGGKAVTLAPGAAVLRFTYKCRISHYVVQVVCRGPAAVTTVEQARATPVVLALKVTNLKDQSTRQWRQRITYLPARYEDGAHLYFPIYEAGDYQIEVSSLPRSQGDLLVDFLALKDVFGELPGTGEKKSQNLLTAGEVQALRNQPASLQLAQKLLQQQVQAGLTDAGKLQAWKEARLLEIWDSQPPRNLHNVGAPDGPTLQKLAAALKQAGKSQTLTWALKPGFGPWTFENPATKALYTEADFQAGKTMGDCALPDDLSGTISTGGERQALPELPATSNWAGAALMSRFQELGALASRRGGEYLRTGNEVAGWEGVCALITFVDMYPDIDFQTQKWDFGGGQFGMNPMGKFAYSGHAWQLAERLIDAYDQLFPLLQKDPDLARILGQRIPWIKSSKDVITLLDTNLLQHVRDCVDRQVIRSGEGDSERICVKAALVQGPSKAGDWMLELPFTRCHIRLTNRGGLQDHFYSSTNVDGCDYIGSVEYAAANPKVAAECAAFVARYKALGGKPLFDLDNPILFPSLVNGAYFNLQRMVAGGFTPRIGDWGLISDPPLAADSDTYRILYRYAFEKTGDPRFAYWLTQWGREEESDALWQSVEAAARRMTLATPLSHSTRDFSGFGMAVLEAGVDNKELWNKSAVVLRAGVGLGHGHNDALSLLYYGKGVRAMVNNGRRGGKNNSRSSRWHNAVEVDEKEFMPARFGNSGVGWLETVQDLGAGLGYTRGSARSPSHPDVKVYRRDVALIPVGQDDAFVFDVFRVAGGKVHTWCAAGPMSEKGGVSFSVVTSPSKLPDDLNAAGDEAKKNKQAFSPEKLPGYSLVDRYLGGWEDRKSAACGASLQITWQVAPAALKRYYAAGGYPHGEKDTAVDVRAWRLETKGQTLLSAWGGFSDYAMKNAPPRNFAYTRAESDKPGLEGAYPTVTETYFRGKPTLQAVESVAVAGGAVGALAAKAVKVSSASGEETLAISDGSGAADLRAAGVQVRGQFASVSRKGGQVTRLALVGGTNLQVDGFALRPAVGVYRATITGLNVPQNSVLVDQKLPAGLLDGNNFLVQRQGVDHDFNYVVEKVSPAETGSMLKLHGSLKVYQSAVTFYHDEGDLSVDMPLVLQECDGRYYDGMALLNEANQVLGQAGFRYGERWMFLLRPWHQDWRQRISKLEDLADSDGDGKRTMRLVATSKQHRVAPDDKIVEAGQTMATLEITRVSPAGDMLWFKDVPEVYADAIGVPHREWPYHEQQLVSEDGTRILQSNYPGDEVYLGALGKKLTQEQFPDADGDGRRCVSLLQMSPGDVLSCPSAVSLTEVAAGVYRLRSNCPLELATPGPAARLAVRHVDGSVSVRQPKAGKDGSFAVDAQTLASGEVFVVIPAADGGFTLPVR